MFFVDAGDGGANDGEGVVVRVAAQEKSSSGRQLSPQQQLRAALLKGRFADLIVKSQERALLEKKVRVSECVWVWDGVVVVEGNADW